MSEVKVEIRGNAGQFGDTARRVKSEISEIIAAANHANDQTRGIRATTNPLMPSTQKDPMASNTAAAMAQALMKAAADRGKQTIDELHNAADDMAGSAAAKAGRETVKAIDAIKRSSEGLGASLAARMIPFTGILFAGFRMLDNYTEKMVERMNIAQSLGSDSGKVHAAQMKLDAMGIKDDILTVAGTNIRQARADATAGEDSAIAAFKKLGFNPASPSLQRPDGLDLLTLALQNFGAGNQDRESRIALHRLLGRDSARQFEGWAAGGAFNAPDVTSLLAQGDVEGRTMALFKRPDFRRRYYKEMDPLSTFDVEKRETAERLALANQQTELHLKREMLPIDQRLTEVAKERARLTKVMKDEPDPVKKQRYLADALQLDAEMIQLKKTQNQPIGLQASTSARQDPLRSIGADYSPYSANRIAASQAQAVQKLDAIHRGILTLVSETRQTVQALQ